MMGVLEACSSDFLYANAMKAATGLVGQAKTGGVWF